MKRLWKKIPPCLSDVLGFEVVLNQTEGIGIIDDASHYKPLRIGEMRDFKHPQREHHEKRGDGAKYKRGEDGDLRVISSEIRNGDIIQGTQKKILQAYDENVNEVRPNFVLLSCAPSASMIGSDLKNDAELIAQKSGLPVGSVNIHGDKDYLYGISCTLEAMGKLLLKKQETIPNTVNLLGCNMVDWHKDTFVTVEKMVTNAGYLILSHWGMKETTENLRKASAASMNLVVNESGFRLAKYMEAEFGIPYIVGAPFGNAQYTDILHAMQGGASSTTCVPQEDPEVLIIGEQLTANAIRQALIQRGLKNIRVLSFYDMEKSCMMPDDAKLNSEDDLEKYAQYSSVKLVLADPDYKAAMKRDISWIGLPNNANQSPIDSVANFNMAGKALDDWLDEVLMDWRNL